MATHSSVLAWRIPWTKEPGRLQSLGAQGVEHDLSDWACKHIVHYITHIALLECVVVGRGRFNAEKRRKLKAVSLKFLIEGTAEHKTMD